MSRIIATDHEPVVIPPRKPLTPKQRAELLLLFKGRCALCGEKIMDGDWRADHRTPREFTGDDSIEAYQPLHTVCDKPKTAKDQGDIAKVKRIARKFSTPRSEWPATQKIRSAGFSRRKWES